jgi:hypothetical protein
MFGKFWIIVTRLETEYALRFPSIFVPSYYPDSPGWSRKTAVSRPTSDHYRAGLMQPHFPVRAAFPIKWKTIDAILLQSKYGVISDDDFRLDNIEQAVQVANSFSAPLASAASAQVCVHSLEELMSRAARYAFHFIF